MPFTIVRNDITKMNVDAVVNAANPACGGAGMPVHCVPPHFKRELWLSKIGSIRRCGRRHRVVFAGT